MSETIVVVGGGAAGMMAAIAAAERGATVTLLEPNERLGKKAEHHRQGPVQRHQQRGHTDAAGQCAPEWKIPLQCLFPL